MNRRPVPALLLAFIVFVGPASGGSAPVTAEALPKSISAGARYSLSSRRHFDRESMYQHVNGEAELFKRYGANRLVYAVYDGPNGSSASVDVVEMSRPEAAFGLYRLYAGCDEQTPEENVHTGRLRLDGSTAFACSGNLFLRFSAYDARDPSTLVRSLLAALPVWEDPDLSARLSALEALTRRRCDVRYFPDAVDPRFDTGPGYRWITREGMEAAVAQCPGSGCNEIEIALKSRGERAVVSGARHVAWIRGREAAATDDLRAVVSLFDAGKTR